MSYLAMLKAKIGAERIHDGPGTEPTKPPEPSFVGFGSSVSGTSENFQGAASAAAGPAARPDYDIERAAIVEHEAGVPREWAEGYARLLSQPAPAGVTPARWQTFLDDCGRFLDGWAARAAVLGWQAHDLFGLAEIKPAARVNLAGLCWLLRGCELVALTDKTGAIRTPSGAIQRYHCTGPQVGQRVAWELDHGHNGAS